MISGTLMTVGYAAPYACVGVLVLLWLKYW